MESFESIKYLENLKKGEFCTINIPLTNNQTIPVTAMYMGIDKERKI